MEKNNVKKICDYKGLKLGKQEVAEITEEELNAEIEKMLANSNSTKEKEGKSENGDIVNIDFEGFVDGIAFEGGKGEKYDLELGSGSFIPGFEEQLVGFEKGEETDVKVRFPEDYHAENLKGKEAVFKCKVHAVKQKVQPELNDEFVAQYGLPSVDAFKEALKNQMNMKKQQESVNEYLDKICAYLADNSEVEVDDETKESRINEILSFYERSIAQYGTDLESYLQMTGMDLASFKEKLAPEAIKSLKVDAVFDYIEEQEGITASDEEVETELQYVKQQYKLTDEQYNEFASTRRADVKNEIIRHKISEFLVKNND